VITLLPVLGIIRIGSHAAADRFAYLPGLSMYLFLAISVMWFWEKSRARRCEGLIKVMLVACTGMIMLFLSRCTINQIRVWKNSETLWQYVINAFPNRFAVAYNNLAEAYLEEGRFDEAIEEYKPAITIYPPYFEAQTNLGNAYFKKGMVDNAMAEYNKALTIKPDYAKAHCNLGAAYVSKHMYDSAIVSCVKAITLMPDYEEAYYNLGAAYANKGMMDSAIASFRQAVMIRPGYVKAHYGLGIALYSRGDFESAIVHLDRAGKLGYSVNPALMEALKPYRYP
jgi:tetratricopeptide (TPR) repeat protein